MKQKISQGIKYRKNDLSPTMDLKGISFVISGAMIFLGLSKINRISPSPLQTVKITKSVIKPKIPNEIRINKSKTPLTCPRFSTRVESEKYARHEGIPSPNEIPHRK